MGTGAADRRGRHVVKEAWYFNDNFPWLGMADLRAHHRPVVLVHRSIHRAARAGSAESESGAARRIFASFLKLFPVYLFIIPGLICYALAKSGKVPALAGIVGPDGKAVPGIAQGAFPMMVQYLLAAGAARPGRRRIALGADGIAGRSVQRVLDVVHG